MAKFSIKRFLLLNLLLVFITVLVTAIYYSETTARQYITDLRSSANDVRRVVRTLESNLNSPLIDNPGATTSTRTSDAQKLKSTIAECRTRVNELSAKSNTLPSLNYATHLGSFAVADTLKERSHHVVNQTNDTLERYEKTVSFLEVYATSLGRTAKAMDEFNAINDFNEYAGRSNYFRQMATNIQTEADTIAAATAPSELLAIKETGIQTLRQLSSELNDLAYGMDVAIDGLIYSSVQQIEQTDAQLHVLTEKTYGETVSQLRVIKDVYDLNEKLDLILP